jgi:hypothetical protein
LREAFPGFAFVGEETAADEGSYKITDEPTFIVDPVDGTTNAVHRIPAVRWTPHAAARTGRRQIALWPFAIDKKTADTRAATLFPHPHRPNHM